MDQEFCSAVMTAEAAPGSMTQTTKSGRGKCCRLGMTGTGNLAVAVLTLVLYLAPQNYCMPIKTTDGINHHWWHTPCGPGGNGTTTPAGTNGQVKSFRRMKTQLQLTHNHYNSLQLKDVYSEVVNRLEENYIFPWLLENQLEWFKEEFGRSDSNIQDAPKLLYQLHEGLQRFAVTLDKLYRHQQEEDNVKFNKLRSKSLLELCFELRKLLCEVEESLSTAGKQLPNPPVNSTIIPMDNWDTRSDKTAILIQDWGILDRYEKFLVDWRSIVDKLLESASGNKKRRMNSKVQHNRKKGKGNKKRRKGQNSPQEERRGTAVESGVEESVEEATPAGEVKRRTRGGGRRGGAGGRRGGGRKNRERAGRDRERGTATSERQ